jgi:hypothetical protein
VFDQRRRPILFAIAILATAWLLAVVGFRLTRDSRMTAEKLRAYTLSLDFSKLTGAERAAAIQKLAAGLNALSPEERRRARLDRIASGWFENMTEEEKSGFIEATMPTGFRQMIASFEQLPEARRRKALDDAMRRLREAGERMGEENGFAGNSETNQPAVLSKELQEQMTKIGLKTFYSESTAQTKAELAPVLEELQRMMESGRMFRGYR